MNENTGANRPYDGEPAAVVDVVGVETVEASDDVQGDETVELRAEIAQTQADLSETINAIQDKLNPQTMMDRARDTARETAADIATQAKETVREATIGKAEHMVSDVGATARGTGSSIMETIRQNPLPAALAAIGVGWLWMNRARGASDGNGSYQSSARPSYGAYGTATPYGRWNAEYDNDASGMSGAQDAVRQGVQQAQDTAGRLANQAQTGASILAAGTQQQAQRAQGQFQQMLQETPLAVGGIALALGAAVGLAIPETPPEHQLMGEARDTLMQKAQSSAQDTMQKVQDVAQKVGTTAADTAKNEAQNAGLTGQ